MARPMFHRAGKLKLDLKFVKDIETWLSILHPQEIEDGSPVVIWTSDGGVYDDLVELKYHEILTHLASYGFIVGVIRTARPGINRDIQRAIEYLKAENERSDSFLFKKVGDAFGLMGHNQGAWVCSFDQHNEYVKAFVNWGGMSRGWAKPSLHIGTTGEFDKIKIPSSFDSATGPSVQIFARGHDFLRYGFQDHWEHPVWEDVAYEAIGAMVAWFMIWLSNDMKLLDYFLPGGYYHEQSLLYVKGKNF